MDPNVVLQRERNSIVITGDPAAETVVKMTVCKCD